MSNPTKSIIFSKQSIFDALQKTESYPINLISVPDRQDLHNFACNNESENSSSYIGLDIDSLFSADAEDDLSKFLSLFPKRNLVLIEKVNSGEVSSSIGAYKTLRKFVEQHLQNDQIGLNRWSIILVVDSEAGMSIEDKGALSSFKKSIRTDATCVYVMEGRLRAANNNRGPHSKYVWDTALPPLLVHLEEKRKHNRHSESGIYVWRSIVIDPSIDSSPVKTVLREWIQSTVLSNQDGNFNPIQFSPDPIKPPLCKLPEMKKLPGFGEFTEEKPREKNRYKKNVDKQLQSGNLKHVNKTVAQQMRDRGEIASKKVDEDVESQGQTLWQQASSSPSLLVTMKSSLVAESSSFRQKMFKGDVADPWLNLIAALRKSETERTKTLDDAEIVDIAEAHYIDGSDRLLIAFVSILVVFYLVFVSLYPVVKLAGIGLSGFLLACLLGLLGVCSALYLSYFTEKVIAGGRGVKKLTDQLDRASKYNPTDAAMNHLAEAYTKNQNLAWAELIDGAIFLAERAQKTVERVTLQETLGEIDHPVDVNRSEAATDLKIFQEGSQLWNESDIEAKEIKSHASSLKSELSDDYARRLAEEWRNFATESDSNAHGSYPVHDIERAWGRSLASLSADFQKDVYEKVIEPIGTDYQSIRHLKEKFKDLRNLSLSAKPLLSSNSVKKSDDLRQFVWVNNNERLLDELKSVIGQNLGFKYVTDQSSDTLPFCGLFVEEVPMHLSPDDPEEGQQ